MGLAVLLALHIVAPGIAEARKVLRVGVSGDYAPFALEKTPGTDVGMDLEIAERLARDLGYDIRWVPFRWPDLLARLRAGEIDIAMSGVTMHAERAVVGRFTRPYATFGAMAVIRVEDAKRFDSFVALDRKGIRIAVNKGGYLERLARAVFRHASLRTTTNNQSLPELVLAAQVDAVISDSAEVRGWLRGELRAIGPFTHDHKAILLPADAGELARRINEWMESREKDGWLKACRERWLGKEAAMDEPLVARDAVGALIRLRLELMPSVAAAKRAARVPIDDPAQEERVTQRLRALDASRKTLGVYRVLMEIAKNVQQASAAAPTSQVQLSTLRDAIARIDEQLVRELNTAKGEFRDWRDQLDRELNLPGVDAQAILRLAFVLARAPEKEPPPAR